VRWVWLTPGPAFLFFCAQNLSTIAALLQARYTWTREFSMTINTLIVDDEKPAREELAFLLKAFPDIPRDRAGKKRSKR